MQFTSIVVSAALFLASGSYAWTKDANGVWTANNTYHTIRGSTVHEACTTMNTESVHTPGTSCAYWTNGIGDIFHGKCQMQGNSMLCI